MHALQCGERVCAHFGPIKMQRGWTFHITKPISERESEDCFSVLREQLDEEQNSTAIYESSWNSLHTKVYQKRVAGNPSIPSFVICSWFSYMVPFMEMVCLYLCEHSVGYWCTPGLSVCCTRVECTCVCYYYVCMHNCSVYTFITICVCNSLC